MRDYSQNRRGKRVEPKWVLKLVDLVGVPMAADEIGLKRQAVRNIFNGLSKQTYAPTERKAHAAYRRITDEKQKQDAERDCAATAPIKAEPSVEAKSALPEVSETKEFDAPTENGVQKGIFVIGVEPEKFIALKTVLDAMSIDASRVL